MANELNDYEPKDLFGSEFEVVDQSVITEDNPPIKLRQHIFWKKQQNDQNETIIQSDEKNDKKNPDSQGNQTSELNNTIVGEKENGNDNSIQKNDTQMIKFIVAHDDELLGGTKQRILVPFLQSNTAHEFLYTSPSHGFAQVALAHAARRTGKKAGVFLAAGLWSDITLAAHELGAQIHQFPGNMKAVRSQMADYAGQQPSETVCVVPFGGEDPLLIAKLAAQISGALPRDFAAPPRVWLVVGSGVVLRALHKVWPQAQFCCVQVGKPIYADILRGINAQVFVAPEKFWEVALNQPPFASVTTYDAKLWQFFAQYGQEGDLIWNVARDPVAPPKPALADVLGSSCVLDLPLEKINKLITTNFDRDPQFFFSWLAKYIRDGFVAYPWKANFLHPKPLFQNLLQSRKNGLFLNDEFKPIGISWEDKLKKVFPFTYQGEYRTIRYEAEDYEAFDCITDCFQEEARLSAVCRGQKNSPLETWRQSGGRIAQQLYERGQDLTGLNLREEMYKFSKECTLFKPFVALTVFRMFEARRILDFSSGWGDRLVAAMAHRVERYVGVDPNKALQKGYGQILETLLPEAFPDDPLGARARFSMICSPFETAILPADEQFDLVFTSPPFFDFESYSQEAGQSILSFSSFEKWLRGFLFVALEKAWSVLQDCGHMVIHISDNSQVRICPAMNLFILTHLPGARYLGVLGTQGSSNKRVPMWVWQKEANAASTDPGTTLELQEMLRQEMQVAAAYSTSQEGELIANHQQGRKTWTSYPKNDNFFGNPQTKNYRPYLHSDKSWQTDTTNHSYQQRSQYNNNSYQQRSQYNNNGYQQRGQYNNNGYQQRSQYNNNGYQQRGQYNNNGYQQRSQYNNNSYQQRNQYNNNGYQQRNQYNNNSYQDRKQYNNGYQQRGQYNNNGYQGGQYNNNYQDRGQNKNNDQQVNSPKSNIHENPDTHHSYRASPSYLPSQLSKKLKGEDRH